MQIFNQMLNELKVIESNKGTSDIIKPLIYVRSYEQLLSLFYRKRKDEKSLNLLEKNPLKLLIVYIRKHNTIYIFVHTLYITFKSYLTLK